MNFGDNMKETVELQGSIIVGAGVTVKGVFKVPNRAVINGSLEGELDADELLIGKGGKLVGAARVKRADVHGEAHNSLHASEQLTVRGTGRIHGKATYGLIEIERGGLIHGEVVSIEQQQVGLPVLMEKVTESSPTDQAIESPSEGQGKPQDTKPEAAR